MDNLLQTQFFRDEHRMFNRELFRNHVNPLLDVIDQDESINTTMYTPDQLFDLAVSVAKKRSYYSPAAPKQKKSEKKPG